MSVYTQITTEEMYSFLSSYDVGSLVHFEGIQAGIENTNYFVDTDQDHFVLTLFESHEFEEMGYFLKLMDYLHQKGVPSVWPIASRSGQLLQSFKGKPCTLVHRLSGKDISHPQDQHCHIIGDALGYMHKAGKDFPDFRANDRDHLWWEARAEELLPHLPDEDAQLLSAEIHFQSENRFDHLPQGIIHADLFRDNALFDGNKLGGIIDFYYACNSTLLYDLSVTLNDWCSQEDGSINTQLARAMCDAYQQQRPLSMEEKHHLPDVLRAAALRFWVSRLYDQQFPKEGHLTHCKNPDAFRQILNHRINYSDSLQDCFHEPC